MWRKKMESWETEETKKKSSDVTRKIILVMIVLVIVAIAVIAVLLMNIQQNTYRVFVDNKQKTFSSNFMQKIDDTTYINIEEMANMLDYSYHIGEYKVFSQDEDKCYIQSSDETASFYLNSNKIAKLAIDAITEDYDVVNSEKNITKIAIKTKDGNGVETEEEKFYAPIDAIEKGFNVKIQTTSNRMSITTLNAMITKLNSSLNKVVDAEQKTTMYKDFTEEESFNNKKAALYNYIVFFKNSSQLYGVMDTKGKEILPDKYKKIEFSESTQEFFVTNSLDKMGIIDANGQNKIEQNYDTIKLINREPKLYMVSVLDKYGVVNEVGKTLIYPEYDTIGIDSSVYTKEENQYVLQDEIIPVCQNKKYGWFRVSAETGEKIVDVKYDGIGYEVDKIKLNESEKPVNPTISIEDCHGIVVKLDKKYALLDATTGKELVPANADGIYSLTSAGKNTYYYAFRNKEYDLIQELIKAGRIEDPDKITTETPQENTTTNTATTPTNTVVPSATNVMANTFTTTQTAPVLNAQPQR